MTDEMTNRISASYNMLYQKGIIPGLIIAGRKEKELIRGQKTFLGCQIIIDENSKSRCDVYGNEKVKAFPEQAD